MGADAVEGRDDEGAMLSCLCGSSSHDLLVEGGEVENEPLVFHRLAR